MKRIVPVIILVGVLALALAGMLLASNPGNPGEQKVTAPRDIPVATVLYQWFGYAHDRDKGWPAAGGLRTFHHNDIISNELITGFTVNQSEIGRYASDSDETIAWQLQEMQEAGINTIIVSWWGWGDADLDGTYEGYIEQRSHDALIRLLNYIQRNDLDFKVALMVEPWPDIVTPTLDWVLIPGRARNLSADKKQMILDHVWDNVYSIYPNLIFLWEGKPLLAAVGELYFDPDEDAPEDRFTLRSFRFKPEDVDPGNAWDWIITEPLPYFQNVDGAAILSSRYDEWFLAAAHPKWFLEGAWPRTEPLRKDPYLAEHLYDHEWNQVYQSRDEVDLIIVWAWNSWMEQLYIEPDDGEGAAPAGDLLVRKTAWYARRLMSGAPFEMFQPDWTSVGDFRTVINPVSPEQLNLRSDVEHLRDKRRQGVGHPAVVR